MKLNMIVVITVWLPRQACRAPGTAPHTPPNNAAASTMIGSISHAGSCAPKAKAAKPAPSPPITAWPSPPMLNKPPWKATATARPVKMKVVA